MLSRRQLLALVNSLEEDSRNFILERSPNEHLECATKSLKKNFDFKDMTILEKRALVPILKEVITEYKKSFVDFKAGKLDEDSMFDPYTETACRFIMKEYLTDLSSNHDLRACLVGVESIQRERLLEKVKFARELRELNFLKDRA